MIVLFDGDVIVYRCAFAVEKEFLGWGGRVGVWNLRYTMSHFIENILEKFDTQAYLIYLGESNGKTYRTEECKHIDYKGNRRNLRKPCLYRVAREILKRDYNTRVVEGIEADDALGINQTKETVIVSVDKDLRMIPGRHYNPMKDSHIKVKDPGKIWKRTYDKGDKKVTKVYSTGFAAFATQMITGDTVDNIPGIRGKGPIAAYEYLNECKSIEDYWSKVCSVYKELKISEEYRDETADMLWIQRHNGERFKEWLGDRYE